MYGYILFVYIMCIIYKFVSMCGMFFFSYLVFDMCKCIYSLVLWGWGRGSLGIVLGVWVLWGVVF